LRRCDSGRVSRGTASSLDSGAASLAAASDGCETDPCGDVIGWPLLIVGAVGTGMLPVEFFGAAFEEAFAALWKGSSEPVWRRTVSFAVIGCDEFVVLEPLAELEVLPLLVLPLGLYGGASSV
jgi:hypothetical protein